MSNKVHNVDPSSEASNPIPIQEMPDNNYRTCMGCLLILGYISTMVVIITLPNNYFVRSVLTLKDPTFDIDSLTLSNLNVSLNPNQISANWNISTSLTNMDMHGYFNFSAMTFAIYYYDVQVGLAGFHQPLYINPVSPVMQVVKEFSGSSGYVNDSTISKIRKDIDAGTVIYNVRFQSMVEKAYRKGRKHDELYPCPWIVVCENVELNFGSSLDKSRSQMLNHSHICKSSGFMLIV